ncbi:MAG: DNA methyltransferase [Candidatus Omnitrophota bacterium]|jgi:site-specific DNA-methyltransferase (adenine-specific)
MEPLTGTLYIGDNLQVMREDIADGCIDLIYLDPPFNSNRNYNCNFKDEGQELGFKDTWNYLEHQSTTDKEFKKIELQDNKLSRFLTFIKEGSVKDSNHFAYLTFMAARLQEMKRVLKPTGSIYLHVDPTESHYLKIVMDLIFGVENFRNEIVWGYKTGGASKQCFSQKHDIILYYSNGKNYYFNTQKEKSYTKSKSRKAGVINYGAGTAEFFKDDDGIYNLTIMRDVWDIPYINSQAAERLGYPTQKPEALLERIISASCPQNGIMLDPFCGCGTSCAVAAKKGILYVGIDITSIAREVIFKRFDDAGVQRPDLISRPPNEIEAIRLADSDKYASQEQICKKLGIQNHSKKGADNGIDGHQNYRNADGSIIKLITSVKSGSSTISQLRDLIGVVARENADIGIFVTKNSPTKNMLQECNKHGNYKEDVPKIQMLTISQVYNGDKIKLPAGATLE